MFFNKMADVFFFRTNPASNIAKPKAINMTKIPQKTNKNVLSTNAVSAETSALANPETRSVGTKKVNICIFIIGNIFRY